MYAALRDRLDATYTVVPPCSGSARGEAAAGLSKGEADFVILHPQRGLLVIEVKGGDIEFHGNTWYRRTSKGLKQIKNPLEQGRKSEWHTYVGELEEDRAVHVTGYDLTHGHIAVFPRHDKPGQLLPLGGHDIVAWARDVPYIEQSIARAYAFWEDKREGQASASLTQAQYTRGPRRPAAALRAPPPGRVHAGQRQRAPDRAHRAAALLPHELAPAAEALGRWRRRIGKTLLALQQALARAEEGHRTLLCCYNAALAEWLRHQLARDNARGPRVEHRRADLPQPRGHPLQAGQAPLPGAARSGAPAVLG